MCWIIVIVSLSSSSLSLSSTSPSSFYFVNVVIVYIYIEWYIVFIGATYEYWLAEFFFQSGCLSFLLAFFLSFILFKALTFSTFKTIYVQNDYKRSCTNFNRQQIAATVKQTDIRWAVRSVAAWKLFLEFYIELGPWKISQFRFLYHWWLYQRIFVPPIHWISKCLSIFRIPIWMQLP